MIRKRGRVNFFESSEGYFIIIDRVHIQVSKEVYMAYKNSHDNIAYSDKKWGCKINCGAYAAGTYAAQAKLNNPEERYLLKELLGGLLKKLSSQDRLIVKRLAEGYSESEIAEEIGISRQYVNKRKHQIKKML